MIVKINDIWGYYINPDKFSYRRKSIEDTVNSLSLKGTTRIAYNETCKDRANTMSSAHRFLLQQAVIDNNFPCIVFEDDAKSIKPLPEYFDIPEEVTLIYLGGSNYDCGAGKPNVYIEEYNKDYYRVYYMLSFHAVIIPSALSANFLIDSLTWAIENTKFNDITISLKSKDNIFLVPKEGNYFYQDDYTSSVTNFLWGDVSNKLLR